jgi:hypothetical protein
LTQFLSCEDCKTHEIGAVSMGMLVMLLYMLSLSDCFQVGIGSVQLATHLPM